ncbi:flagellin, partial [Salmonella enterica subsp. enterica serovar Heidelberg str. 24393]
MFKQKYKVSDTAATVTGYTDSATAIDKSTFAASATTLGGTPAITGDLKFDDTTGKYYADVSGTTAK